MERKPVGAEEQKGEKQEKDESEKENKACEKEGGLKEGAPGKPEGIGGYVYKRALQR